MILVLIVLSIRPYNQNLYNKLYGIDVGGWNMYKYDLKVDYSLSLYSSDKNIDFNMEKYLWHGVFAGSHHPHYNIDLIKKWLELFIKKDEIKQVIDSQNIEKIIFKMKLIKNNIYWKTVVIEKDLNDI